MNVIVRTFFKLRQLLGLRCVNTQIYLLQMFASKYRLAEKCQSYIFLSCRAMWHILITRHLQQKYGYVDGFFLQGIGIEYYQKVKTHKFQSGLHSKSRKKKVTNDHLGDITVSFSGCWWCISNTKFKILSTQVLLQNFVTF